MTSSFTPVFEYSKFFAQLWPVYPNLSVSSWTASFLCEVFRSDSLLCLLMRPLCGFKHSSQGQLWPVPALLTVTFGHYHKCPPTPKQAVFICTGKAHSKLAWLLTSYLKCVSFFLVPLGKAAVVWCTKNTADSETEKTGCFSCSVCFSLPDNPLCTLKKQYIIGT